MTANDEKLISVIPTERQIKFGIYLSPWDRNCELLLGTKGLYHLKRLLLI